MRTSSKAVVLSLALMATLAHAQVTITTVANAASYIHPPLPNSSIAQGAFFVILGSSSQTTTATAAWTIYPLPIMLANTTVTVTAGTTSGNPLLYYVGPSASGGTQIDAVMPSDTPVGPAMIVVTQNGMASAPFAVNVVASSPGAYTLNGAGSGPGLFFNVASDGSLTPNNLFHTAKPGQLVALHATGLAPVANPSKEGLQAPYQVDVRSSNFLVDVYVGGQPATVQYAGRTSYTAEDEIVFTVPAGVSSGCYNEVAVSAGPSTGSQTISNFTSLAVDTKGAVCQDADGINYKELAAAVKSKGSADIGAISLLSNYIPINFLGTMIQFDNDTVNGEIATLSTQQVNESFGFTTEPSVNNCSVTQFLQFPPPIDPTRGGLFYLDAGPDLTITGGTTGSMQVPKTSNGEGYGALVGGISQLLQGGGLPPYYLNSNYAILPATYAVTGPGGTQAGAFSATLQVTAAAAAFKWTNSSIANNFIPRNTPLTITWTGGDPNGFVGITLIGSTTLQSVEPLPTDPGEQVQCVAPTSAGSFTIPTYVLEALPSTLSSPSPTAGELLVGPLSGAVPITPAPSGLDAAWIFYQFVAGLQVWWQ